MILFLHQVPHTLLIPYFWQYDFFHDTQQDFSNTTFKAISIFLHYIISYNVSHSLYHLLQRKIPCTEWSLLLRTKSLCSHLEISLFLLLPIKRRDTISSISSATWNKSLLNVLTGMLNKDKQKPRPSRWSCNGSCWLHYFPRNCSGRTQSLSSVGSSPKSG